jgi:hypothetical protein
MFATVRISYLMQFTYLPDFVTRGRAVISSVYIRGSQTVWRAPGRGLLVLWGAPVLV